MVHDVCMKSSSNIEARTKEWNIFSVHLTSLRCTERGRETTPVYLSPHLRVLICFRLMAGKEGSTETMRQSINESLKRRDADKKEKNKNQGGTQSEQQGAGNEERNLTDKHYLLSKSLINLC